MWAAALAGSGVLAGGSGGEGRGGRLCGPRLGLPLRGGEKRRAIRPIITGSPKRVLYGTAGAARFASQMRTKPSIPTSSRARGVPPPRPTLWSLVSARVCLPGGRAKLLPASKPPIRWTWLTSGFELNRNTGSTSKVDPDRNSVSKRLGSTRSPSTSNSHPGSACPRADRTRSPMVFCGPASTSTSRRIPLEGDSQPQRHSSSPTARAATPRPPSPGRAVSALRRRSSR